MQRAPIPPYAAFDEQAQSNVNIDFYVEYRNREINLDPDDYYGDDSADVQPEQNHTFALGHVFLKTNHRHNIEFAQKLWYVQAGFNSGGPVLPVFEGYHNTYNFGVRGPPRHLERSNAASVGFLSRELFALINGHRANRYDREGPRHGHTYKKRVDMYALEEFEGFVEGAYPERIPVIAMWRS
jgi:hypothetical protein